MRESKIYGWLLTMVKAEKGNGVPSSPLSQTCNKLKDGQYELEDGREGNFGKVSVEFRPVGDRGSK